MVELIFQLDKSGQPNQDRLRIPLPHPGLKLDGWKSALDGYFDRKIILDSVEFGWDLSLMDNPSPRDAKKNHPSAINNPADTWAYIKTELEFGCLVGPVVDLPFKVACSPLGSVPKSGSNTRRTITDCTYAGRGINEWIPRQWYRGLPCKIKLPGMADIVADIASVRSLFPGEEILGFKLDLSRYYRNLRVDPGQAKHLGIRWNQHVYLDLAFSFGNRAAMVGAQRTSDGLAWFFRTKVSPDGMRQNSGVSCACQQRCRCGDNTCQAYVDDFIAIVPKSSAWHLWNSFLSVLDSLGLSPSSTPGHLSPPSNEFVGLGVLFNLANNTASIPPDKVAKTLLLIETWMGKSEASLLELQKIIGSLMHCAKVVRSGRLHTNRMLDTLRRAYHIPSVPLDSCFKADLEWWKDALVNWNGISTLVFTSHENNIALDASTNGGVGGGPGLGGVNFRHRQFFRCNVPDYLLPMHINELELLAHLVCVHLWAGMFAGSEVKGETDNESCRLFLDGGRSRIDIRLRMSRTLTHFEHMFDFQWIAHRVSTHDNTLPDCLSRWGMHGMQNMFWSQAGSMGLHDLVEVPVLDHYFDLDFRFRDVPPRPERHS